MPIEREFKYVLRSPDELWERLTRKPKKLVSQIDMKQGYLSRGGRIRSKSYTVDGGKRTEEKPRVEYIFTYKHDLSSQPGCLEIETPLSKEDFELAWSEADHKISKTRVVVADPHGRGSWEIDFFSDEEGIYLAMAEFEVPADAGPPDRLLPIVQEYLVFAVPEEDGRFKNRKLCERLKVLELLKEIA